MTSFTRLSLLLLCFITLSCDQFNSTKNNSSTSEVIDNSTNELALLDNEFLIKGSTFSDDLKTVYLHKLKDRTSVIIDSAAVVDKGFSFKGIIDSPDYYKLSSNISDKQFLLLLDHSKIDVFLNESIENSSSYSSTTIQKAFSVYSKSMYDFRNKGVDLYYNLKGNFSTSSIAQLKKDRSKLFSEHSKYTTKFIETNQNSAFTPILIKQNIEAYGHQKLREFYDSLSDDIKALSYTKDIDSMIILKENAVAKPIPVSDTKVAETKAKPKSTGEYRPKAYSFSGSSPYGETYTLNSIPRGKVILLDFWASWCIPCRNTNPDLVALYNKYNAQGLEIMSISEDKGEAEWMTAINVDNLSWDYHIIDKNKSIAFRYGVESIPFKLLIDKNGNIASDKISGRKLESRIKQLLAK